MTWKRASFSIMMAFVLLLTVACSNEDGTSSAHDMGQIYSIALDAYMPIDEGLNGGMEYIAIDMTNFENVSDEDKAEILAYFQKYNVEVLEATFEQLKEDGRMNQDTIILDGVLLRVDKTEISKNKVIIEGNKFRAGNGAIGTRVTVERINGQWQVTQADGTWIS